MKLRSYAPHSWRGFHMLSVRSGACGLPPLPRSRAPLSLPALYSPFCTAAQGPLRPSPLLRLASSSSFLLALLPLMPTFPDVKTADPRALRQSICDVASVHSAAALLRCSARLSSRALTSASSPLRRSLVVIVVVCRLVTRDTRCRPAPQLARKPPFCLITRCARCCAASIRTTTCVWRVRDSRRHRHGAGG